jgi:uncharacterized OB-fold protein
MLTALEVQVLKCSNCNAYDPGPRDICVSCLSRSFVTEVVVGEGELSSYTVVRRPPTAHLSKDIYAVAAIRLDVGINITARLKDPTAKPRLGARMRATAYGEGFVYFEGIA